MKKYFSLIIALLIISTPSVANAQCTGTCITPEIIAAADHLGPPPVIYSPAITHYEYLFIERGDYRAPTFTNVTVYRQEAPGKIGEVIDYPDAFCTMEGYAFGRFPTAVERIENYQAVVVRPVQVPVFDANGDPVLDDDGNQVTRTENREFTEDRTRTVTDIIELEGCAP